MPRAPRGSLPLSDQERREFGKFLRDCREKAGLSIRRVAVALAGKGAKENRGRIKAYESGSVVPTDRVALRLAGYYRLSALDVLLRAGYATELLRPIYALLATTVRDKEEAELRRKLGIRFALHAFPRRGEEIGPLSIFQGELEQVALTINTYRQPAGKLPRELRLANTALHESAISGIVRRYVAAEYVHAYLMTVDHELYRKHLRATYKGQLGPGESVSVL